MNAPSFSFTTTAPEKRIIALEGLDGTGKSALAKELINILGADKSTAYHLAAPNQGIGKNTFFEHANLALSKMIEAHHHQFIILDRSWLSGEATRFASEKGPLRKWPENLYQPTHIFLLTLPEAERLRHMRNRLKEVPFTEEEMRLENDAKYRSDYEWALKKGAKMLRTRALFRKLNGAALTIHQMALNIVSLLTINLALLNPRALATSDKLALRPLYQSWKQRPAEAEIPSGEFIKIIANASLTQKFDDDTRKRHECHFDNIGKVFEYNKFAGPRHPPVLVGVLEARADFDEPFPNSVLQAQDMPISFPTHDIGSYEYRLPACYAKLGEFVSKVANTWHALEPEAYKYFCYLSISHGVVSPWQHQRRPNIHCDGFQSARISPKIVGEYAFVASNSLPTLFYIDPFDTSQLDPAKHNFFTAYSKRSQTAPLSCQKKYEIMMMDPYCFHAAAINMSDHPIKRTFARMLYSTRIYDRLGNTHNPAFNYHWEMVCREAQLDLEEFS